MFTKLTIRNFKRFDKVEIPLGNPVLLIGPNNSGKTTVIQALSLWGIGLRRWNEKRKGKQSTVAKSTGVTINRRDLIAAPVPGANLLWRDLHVREIHRENGFHRTMNVRVDIIVEGVTGGSAWQCGLEFDCANEEILYCRPLRLSEGQNPERMHVPDEAEKLRVAFLPPISGLAAYELKLDPGAINVRIGEGRTAEVLRNLCYQLANPTEGENSLWQKTCEQIEKLFGVKLEKPIYIMERGEITMSYQDHSGVNLDLSSSGRGLQQTLLLLAYLAVNPNSVLLLDEPDTHLEILRQRQIYELLVNTAREQGSQLIIASHSEVILNEAADRDTVVAFVGQPHRIDDRGSQVLKSLKEIGFEQYYQAEQTGWVLYLEGSTDLAILRAFAEKLSHPAQEMLASPFVNYVYNQPAKARQHFYGLREAKSDLVGYALFDRLERSLESQSDLQEYMWRRREAENYFCMPDTLLAYAEDFLSEASPGPMFDLAIRGQRRGIMQECIEDFVPRAAQRDLSDRWWIDTKASDDFLDRLFETFFRKLSLPNLMNKTDYHVLVRFVPVERIDPEVSKVLDEILATAKRAHPIMG